MHCNVLKQMISTFGNKVMERQMAVKHNYILFFFFFLNL